MKKVLNLILIIVLILIICTAYREHSQRSEPTAQENKAFPIPSTTEDENEDRDKSNQSNSQSVTKKQLSDRNKPTSKQLADKCYAQHQELTISSQELEAQLQHHGINQLLFPIDYQPTAQEILIKLQQAGIETTQVGKEWLFVTTIQTAPAITVQTNTAYANDKARKSIEKTLADESYFILDSKHDADYDQYYYFEDGANVGFFLNENCLTVPLAIVWSEDIQTSQAFFVLKIVETDGIGYLNAYAIMEVPLPHCQKSLE